MSIELTAMLVVIALLSITTLVLAWQWRFQIIGLAILVGWFYLMLTNDTLFVFRIPTLCILSIAVVFSLFTLIPRTQKQERQHRGRVR